MEVQVDDAEAAEKLAYLVNGAEQPVEPALVVGYHVRRGPPREVYLDGTVVASVETPDDVLYVVYRDCYTRALEHFTRNGWVQVHAAVASVHGRRFLAVGRKGAGKTTLMARLLHDGHPVEGDEVALTRDGAVLPLPRPFHLKEGTETVVPELAGIVDALPRTATAEGRLIRAFDPSRHGFPWSIAAGPVDALVFLDRAGAGPASVSPVGGLDAVRRLVEHALVGAEPWSAPIAACARLAGDVVAFELHTGPLADTARVLADALLAIPSSRVLSMDSRDRWRPDERRSPR